MTSTSTTEVSWAEVSSDSRMRLAMTLRRRDIFSVVPRSGETSTGAALAGAAGAAGAACAAAAFSAAAFSAAASTSCLRMRPPTPVPVTVARSTPFSAASLRTSGVM